MTRPSALLFVALLVFAGPAGATGQEISADERAEGEKITLPPPGPCATARELAAAPPPGTFYVTGSPTSRLVPHQVSAAPPAHTIPSPMSVGTPPRNPCDGAGGSCVAKTATPFVEPPPVSAPPPPGLPPGVPRSR